MATAKWNWCSEEIINDYSDRSAIQSKAWMPEDLLGTYKEVLVSCSEKTEKSEDQSQDLNLIVQKAKWKLAKIKLST